MDAADLAAARGLIPEGGGQQHGSKGGLESAVTKATSPEGQGVWEVNLSRQAEQMAELAVYTPLFEKPHLWSDDLVKFLSCHSSGSTGETSQFLQRD